MSQPTKRERELEQQLQATLADLAAAERAAQLLQQELEDTEYFITQIDPVHWPCRREARARIASIRRVLATRGAKPAGADQVPEAANDEGGKESGT